MRAARPPCTFSQINPDGSFVVDRELGSWGSDLLQFEFVDRGEMMSGLMCFTVPAPGSGTSPSLLVAEAGNGGCARTRVIPVFLQDAGVTLCFSFEGVAALLNCRIAHSQCARVSY
jgi:hypothetical protein